MPSPDTFPSAEAAWFWTMAAIDAKHDRNKPRPAPAPCHPDEVLRCLDDLYRRRGIELLHVRILRLYGRRGRAPHPQRPGERCDRQLWTEAMEGLDGPLRKAGIVAGVVKWWLPA